MRRASYREAIEYIALNDEPGLYEPEAIIGMISIQLVSILFALPAEKVANDVSRWRKKAEKR